MIQVQITSRIGNDYRATFECEHCQRVVENVACYNDYFFHEQVIPNMYCQGCGKNTTGNDIQALDQLGVSPRKV